MKLQDSTTTMQKQERAPSDSGEFVVDVGSPVVVTPAARFPGLAWVESLPVGLRRAIQIYSAMMIISLLGVVLLGGCASPEFVRYNDHRFNVVTPAENAAELDAAMAESDGESSRDSFASAER